MQKNRSRRTGRVLCVIFDHALALVRCAALERAGFEAVRATSVEQALPALARGGVTAVVVGHFVPPEHASEIVALAHEKRVPCLVLFSRGLAPPASADAQVDVADGEQEMLRVLQKWQIDARAVDQ